MSGVDGKLKIALLRCRLCAQVPPGKTLVVKFADRAIASRNAAVGGAGAYQGNGHVAGNGNGHLYM